MRIVDSTLVNDLTQQAFLKAGLTRDESEIMAAALIDASLTGYDSHGIIKLPFYVDMIREQHIKSGAELKVVKQTGASAYIDCNHAPGPVSAKKVLELGSDMAASQGVACISCVNSTYIARLGGFVEQVALKGQIAVLMVNDAGGYPAAAPFGGVAPFFSTNPLAAGIPRENAPPVVIDVSTSTAAIGKLRLLKNQGELTPEGWLTTRDGSTTRRPETFFESPMASALLPLGGLIAGHKGYALSLLVDVLAGGLSGAGCSTGEEIETKVSGFFALVIDPEHFVSRSKLSELLEDMITRLKNSPTAPGFSEILLPGERLAQERARRQLEGIPIDNPSWDQINALLKELDVPIDEELLFK